MHLETGVPQGWLLCGVRPTCCELTSLHVQIFILPWLRSLYLGAGFQAASHIIMWFSSVQSLSRVRLFATPRTAARQASLSITKPQSLLKLLSITSVMPSNHLIFCHSLLLPPSIFPSIRAFTSDSALHQVVKGLEFQLQHQSFQ